MGYKFKDKKKINNKNYKPASRTYRNTDSNWKENFIERTGEIVNVQMVIDSALGEKNRVRLALENCDGADVNYVCSPDAIERYINTYIANGKDKTITSSNGLDFIRTLAGETPLTAAAKKSQFNVVQYLLRNNTQKANINSYSLNDGKTALHTYAFKNQLKEVMFLLEQGADVNSEDAFYNQTPLFYAVINSDTEMLKLLIECGANINHKNKEGQTCVAVACTNEKRNNCLKLLINAKADINISDNNFATPLMRAIKSSNGQASDILLNANCDINKQNINGLTPLMLAAKYGKRETVRVLISKGANLTLQDNRGNTAFDHARISGYPGCMEIITKALKLSKTNEDLSFFGKQNKKEDSCVR